MSLVRSFGYTSGSTWTRIAIRLITFSILTSQVILWCQHLPANCLLFRASRQTSYTNCVMKATYIRTGKRFRRKETVHLHRMKRLIAEVFRLVQSSSSTSVPRAASSEGGSVMGRYNRHRHWYCPGRACVPLASAGDIGWVHGHLDCAILRQAAAILRKRSINE